MGTLLTSATIGGRQVRRAVAGLGTLLMAASIMLLVVSRQPAPAADSARSAVVAPAPAAREEDSGGGGMAAQAQAGAQVASKARSGDAASIPVTGRQRPRAVGASRLAVHYAPFTRASTSYRASYDHTFATSREEASRMWTPTDQYGAAYDIHAPGRTR